jgi:hypothetical protein
MLFPCKCVVVEYNTLIVKMWEDQVESKITISNVHKLLHVNLLLGLHYILLLLELVHILIKYAKRKYVLGFGMLKMNIVLTHDS